MKELIGHFNPLLHNTIKSGGDLGVLQWYSTSVNSHGSWVMTATSRRNKWWLMTCGGSSF